MPSGSGDFDIYTYPPKFTISPRGALGTVPETYSFTDGSLTLFEYYFTSGNTDIYNLEWNGASANVTTARGYKYLKGLYVAFDNEAHYLSYNTNLQAANLSNIVVDVFTGWESANTALDVTVGLKRTNDTYHSYIVRILNKGAEQRVSRDGGSSWNTYYYGGDISGQPTVVNHLRLYFTDKTLLQTVLWRDYVSIQGNWPGVAVTGATEYSMSVNVRLYPWNLVWPQYVYFYGVRVGVII